MTARNPHYIFHLLPDKLMGKMVPMILQLLFSLFALYGYSTVAFVLMHFLRHAAKLAEAAVLSLLLLLLESPGYIRHYWIRATRTLHRRPPTTSRLLSLPQELRLQIWTMILGDFQFVHVRCEACITYPSYADRLRLYMGKNPEYSVFWYSSASFPYTSQPPMAFVQSCRQIYNEAGYSLYCTTRFHLAGAQTLVSWIRSLTPATKRAIRHVRIDISEEFGGFFHSAFNGATVTATTLCSAIAELSGLRKLIIGLWDKRWLSATKYEAHGVYQLVRNVQVSEALVVQLAEETDDSDTPWTEVGWPADSQEEFACAVWAAIRDPESVLEHGVLGGQVEEGGQAKFWLRVKDVKAVERAEGKRANEEGQMVEDIFSLMALHPI